MGNGILYGGEKQMKRYKIVYKDGREEFLEEDDTKVVNAGNIGDYIIKGVKGEFYPCKPDIFEMTYEKVGE
jgi:hypothetical protein